MKYHTWLGQTCSKGNEHVGRLYTGLVGCGVLVLTAVVVGLSQPPESSEDVAFGDFQKRFRRISRLFSCFCKQIPYLRDSIVSITNRFSLAWANNEINQQNLQ